MTGRLGPEFRARLAAAEAKLREISGEHSRGRSRPGGWTRREELGHLIDSALNNHQRFVRGAIQGMYDGPGYRQDDWVALHGYAEMPWTELLEHWRQQNDLLARVVERIPDHRLGSPCVVGGELPAWTLEQVIADYLRHLEDHVLTVTSPGH